MDTAGLTNPLFFVGVVENIEDKRHEGRVQVRAFGTHGTNKEIETPDLPWAICVQGNYDPNNPPPPLNSFVWGVFMDGRNAQHPMILGLIPSQYVQEHDPAKAGWGVIPEKDGKVQAKGMTPQDIGLPQQSRLATGENLNETYIPTQELNRVHDQKVGGQTDTWAEPGSAYAAKYPYNRVIETASHSIELDDSPGGERIMINHKSGAYIQIDSKGTVTERAEADRYEINIGTKHESSGHSSVTINGNAHVYVKGNKTEEIEGDYRMLVHGNAEFGVGGQMNLNGGEQVQIRGGDVKIDANVGVLNLFGKESIVADGGEQVIVTGQNVNITSLLDMELYSTLGMKFTCINDLTASSNDVNFNVGFKGFNIWGIGNTTIDTPLVKSIGVIQATAVSSLRGDFATLGAPLPISTSPGSPCAPGPGRTPPLNIPSGLFFTLPELNFAIPALFAGSQTKMPEPPSKSTNIMPGGYFAMGWAAGFVSPIEDEATDIVSKIKEILF